MSLTPDEELKRGFGLSTATYVVIASMVGTGILVSPGYMMVTLKNYPVIFGLWVLGGLLALCGALCVAELAAALPRAGGEYVYLREAYGPMPAFLSGWTSFFLGFSAPLAVAGYIAALYLLTPFGLAEDKNGLVIKITAAAIIIVITLPNLVGHRQSAWTQNLTTLVKFGLFVLLVVLAFLFGEGRFSNITQGQSVAQISLGTAATQLFYVMFAYSGWNAASYLAGDLETLRSKGLRFPSRHHSVLDRRDHIFFERLADYLNQGDAVVFVGAPHVSGLSKLLREDGYKISGPDIPAANPG